MEQLSSSGRYLIRFIGDAVNLRTYAWSDLPQGPGEDYSETANELAEIGYIERYGPGWRMTQRGIDYLLTTPTPDPQEASLDSRLAEEGFTQSQLDDIHQSLRSLPSVDEIRGDNTAAD